VSFHQKCAINLDFPLEMSMSQSYLFDSSWAELLWVRTYPYITIRLHKDQSTYGRALLKSNEEGFSFSFVQLSQQEQVIISRQHFVIYRIGQSSAVLEVKSQNGAVVKYGNQVVNLALGEKKILRQEDYIGVNNETYFVFRYKSQSNLINFPQSLTYKYLVGDQINSGGQASVLAAYSYDKLAANVAICKGKFALKRIPISRKYDDNTQSFRKRI
jgi:hypothetical protein